MLQRTVTYATLLRILGVCFLLYGFYLIVLALTSQFEMSGSIQYSGPLIFGDPTDLVNYLLYGGPFPGNPLVPGQLVWETINPLLIPVTPGPLLWVGLGILSVSLSNGRALVAYIGSQVALWMISASFWVPILWLVGRKGYDTDNIRLLALVTLVLSLVLLALNKPVTNGLRALVAVRDERAPYSGGTSGHPEPA